MEHVIETNDAEAAEQCRCGDCFNEVSKEQRKIISPDCATEGEADALRLQIIRYIAAIDTTQLGYVDDLLDHLGGVRRQDNRFAGIPFCPPKKPPPQAAIS